MAKRTTGPALAWDWDDLRYFLAVSREGSLSAASRVLRVAQPTVGRRIAAFEEELGAKLFERTPGGQVLSASGRRLVAHAERMEAEALAVARAASGRDAGLRGLVRITASEWMVDRVLCPMIGPFLVEHPGLELELMADPRHLSLVRREAEIALRPSRSEGQEVVEREVAVVAFGLYASEGYLAERGAPDFERQCAGHALIAMSEALGKVPDVAWLPQVAAKASVVARTNGRAPMATLAAAGVGLAVLPRLIGDGTPGLRRLPTPIAEPERQLWLASHRDTRAIPRVRRTLAFLREGLGRLRYALRPVSDPR